MKFLRACSSALLTTLLLTPVFAASPAMASRTHRSATAGHSKFGKKFGKKTRTHQAIGQRGIDADRAREIQSALIQQNYLTGEPTGQWDAETQAAMEKFQADNGWQTKLTPDSRALIKLGLGPNREAAPQTAVTATPAAAAPAAVDVNSLAAAHSISN